MAKRGGVRLDAAVRVVPRDPLVLREWLRTVAGVELPERGLAVGSDSPMEYVVHAFFEGRRWSWEARKWEGGRRDPADCVVWACRGGGKTFLGAVVTMLDLVFKHGIEVRILGGSLEQSQRMYEHLRRLMERPGLSALVQGRATERGVRLANGSRARILAQSERSVRGTRVQKVRCDEVELFERGVWEAAQLATRSLDVAGPWGPRVRGAVEALSTMHVPHGLMWEIVAGAGEKRGQGSTTKPHGDRPPAGATQVTTQDAAKRITRRLIRWGVVDVLGVCGHAHQCGVCDLEPECGGRAKARDAAGAGAGHVSVEDAVALKGRVSEEAWRSEMLCERPRRDGAVLPEFDTRVHVGSWDSPPAAHEATVLWVGGMDFGFRAPTVVLLAWVDGEGVLRVEGEHVEAERSLDRHLAVVLGKERSTTGYWGEERREDTGPETGATKIPGPPRPAWIGVDPAGNQRSDQTGISAVTVLKKAGLTVRSRRLELAAGLEMVRARLRPAARAGDPSGARLFVHERCVKLIESLERYHYPADRPECLEPVKDGNDHAVDALRYLVVNLDRPYVSGVRRYA